MGMKGGNKEGLRPLVEAAREIGNVPVTFTARQVARAMEVDPRTLKWWAVQGCIPGPVDAKAFYWRWSLPALEQLLLVGVQLPSTYVLVRPLPLSAGQVEEKKKRRARKATIAKAVSGKPATSKNGRAKS